MESAGCRKAVEKFECKCSRLTRTRVAVGRFVLQFESAFGRLTTYKLFIFLRLMATLMRWSSDTIAGRVLFNHFCSSVSRDLRELTCGRCQCARFIRFDTESLNKSLWSKVSYFAVNVRALRACAHSVKRQRQN